ncbi:2-dehydro-3-deoxyphosphogluconate aldolase / (4S)-4-hydroxy-2-oxoglutarate aldolase [Thermanaeromonas toyohensis ToBE]|uniref:2-dehydro-3-deoxyphosphogluconate aldolase / (4S)-4-hydroxy-2-oxoglutarate aldolase n=1 Tax=Thermanaeromonas toyohensis ToBE TaxID=698762 RepID=A0A1W1VP98_9FIRM|nr:bifunctional 4-hydroxy-2-oxoglutarate aldolase/2-dehydro-3-deoxy-phosphogluconate aldolase [Thermanaeromonas toyohensis]SMB95178.1 2-dehydro-3-deoxyphosphogluconate aldolase / (4S)-4-hydroxy-2-oxoglutarate aldolase [Thermanaeromonas toyohensis ToBE]
MEATKVESVIDTILQEKLVAILRKIEGDRLFKVIDSLLEAGIRVAEITLNTEGAINLLGELIKRYGEEMLLGAGTVTRIQEVEEAAASGAKFIVTPVMLPEIIQACKRFQLGVILGACSPTEIYQAYSLGADIVKVFPAGSLGPSYFRELQGPLGNVPLAAVGGVTLENGRAFLEAGAKVLGVGSSLTPRQLVNAGDWMQLKNIAKRFKELVS